MIISAISHNDENYKNIFSPAFFNILKETLLVHKQTIPQQKALTISLLSQKDKGMAVSWGCHAHLPQEAFFVDLLQAHGGFLTLYFL